MKKIIDLVLLTFFSATFALSQANLPFPDTSGAWVMTDVAYGSPWDPDIWYSYRHFVGSETIINGKQYREIKEGNYDINDFANSSVIGHYRIDSLKVYYRDLDQVYPNQYGCYLDTGDIVLYDFGIQPSDTFYLANIDSSPAFIILDSIDSVNYNGNYYRRFNFNPYSYYTIENPYYWVEGIGSVEGFFPFFHYFEANHFFHCFHENGEAFEFDLGNSNDCFSIPLGYDELIKDEKELLKRIDFTGREIEELPNKVIIHIYRDGTTEKIFRVE